MAGLVTPIGQILRVHRRQLFGLIEVRGVGRMQKLYAESRAELQDRLRKLERDGRGKTFSAHQMRQVLVQVEDAAHGFERKLAEHLGETGKTAVRLAPRHLVDAIDKLGKHFGASTPIVPAEEAAVFQRVYPQVAPSLLNKYPTSVQTYGVQTIAAVRNELSKSLIQNQSVDEAVARVASTNGAFAGQRWRAERIVRTEASYAYGVAKQVGMEQLQTRVPKLCKRLVATWDDRTGEDSKELDGQVVDVDRPFVWNVKDAKGRIKKTVHYMQPPNRPNDREVVIPWVRGWPEPAKQGGVEPGRLPGGL